MGPALIKAQAFARRRRVNQTQRAPAAPPRTRSPGGHGPVGHARGSARRRKPRAQRCLFRFHCSSWPILATTAVE
eukprot:7763858-Pyramimonas_sp.AAC.1